MNDYQIILAIKIFTSTVIMMRFHVISVMLMVMITIVKIMTIMAAIIPILKERKEQYA